MYMHVKVHLIVLSRVSQMRACHSLCFLVLSNVRLAKQLMYMHVHVHCTVVIKRGDVCVPLILFEWLLFHYIILVVIFCFARV